MKRLPVCLITCDRPEYTKQTVESFMDTNASEPGFERFDLLHADDASEDYRNGEIARKAGFETLGGPDVRIGCAATIDRAARAAIKRGHSHVMLLENDWVSHRPFPWELFDYFLSVSVAYCLRLCGQFKEWDDEQNVGRRPFGKNHAGRNEAPVGWVPLIDAPEPAEMGAIHWGNTPAITAAKPLLFLLDGTHTEKDRRMKSGRLRAGEDYTIRPAFNVFFHIGAERTPNFKR